jgi:hypothetical protein
MDNWLWRKQTSAETRDREKVEDDTGSNKLQNSNDSGPVAGPALRPDIAPGSGSGSGPGFGTGVPDDCRLETGHRSPGLRDLIFKDIQTLSYHAETLSPMTSRIRILPSHGQGTVVEIRLKTDGIDGLRLRHMYILPLTVLGTDRGPVSASALKEGDQLLPDYACVTRIRILFVQADFCRPVSQDPVYVDVGGMYVLTTAERN